MIYNLAISEDAFDDVIEILEWYDELSEKLSARFEIELNSKLKYLTEHPDNFQIRYLKKMRIVPLSTFPYGIHFYLDGELIYVVAVFHYSQSPKRWRNGRQ